MSLGWGPGTNTGHGHVWPRPDGSRMRCGGPAICSECAKDQIRFDNQLNAAIERVGSSWKQALTGQEP